MKFSDLFVPKYLHSNPHVRLDYVAKSTDAKLLEQIAENDEDQEVRTAAADRSQSLKGQTQTV